MLFTCHQCNKQFTSDNSYRSPKFCCKQCYWNSIKQTIHKCLQCHKHFSGPPSRKFCSPKCANRYNQPITRKAIFTCEWCRKQFEEWEYRQPRFCSKKCSGNFGARQPKPSARRPENFVTQNCIICNKSYTVHKTQVRLRGSKYCSNECKHESQARKMMAKNNPNWAGGVSIYTYGPNWEKQARKAKNRDKHTCQKCGYKSGGDRILDTHHIIPFRTFNNYKLANRLENLITLCRTCHIQEEIKIRKTTQT